MKISSLIDSKNHSKYRDVLNKDLEEYVAWFRENKPNNRPFKDLYNDVLEALKNSKVEIKDEEKAQILVWLKEAREYAMDAADSKGKHFWFDKYRGRTNNWLSGRGYDLKKERDAWMKRTEEQKAKQKK